MIIAGITGGIGSGKSTVCKVFELLDVPVYYADEASRNLLSDPGIIKQITTVFSNDILSGGVIDRKVMAGLVFNDPEKLDVLNKIMHPAVKLHFDEWCSRHSEALYVLKEAAILFESGSYKDVQKIILVTSPLELRIARVMKRDAATRDEIEKRISKQLSDEEKMKRSDFVIRNDEEQLLLPAILDIHKALSSR
ncbi:MAG TPA: dephospho-CoA kinase [Bacteroidia bacterium]|jgi:dephospho-CoA kinase